MEHELEINGGTDPALPRPCCDRVRRGIFPPGQQPDSYHNLTTRVVNVSPLSLTSRETFVSHTFRAFLSLRPQKFPHSSNFPTSMALFSTSEIALFLASSKVVLSVIIFTRGHGS